MALEKFRVNGKEYETRLTRIGDDIVIRVFCEGKVSNGMAYHVTVEEIYDLKPHMTSDPIKTLAHRARLDVEEGVYERFINSLTKKE